MLIEYMKEAYPNFQKELPDVHDLQEFYKARTHDLRDMSLGQGHRGCGRNGSLVVTVVSLKEEFGRVVRHPCILPGSIVAGSWRLGGPYQVRDSFFTCPRCSFFSSFSCSKSLRGFRRDGQGPFREGVQETI